MPGNQGGSMAALSAEEFERVIRDALAERDRKRRARLGDPQVYAAADTSAVAAIMTAAAAFGGAH